VELNPQVKKIALHALKQAIKDITGEGSDDRLVAPTCFVMLYQFAPPRYGNMSLIICSAAAAAGRRKLEVRSRVNKRGAAV
jgi:hypothetical protein